MFFISSKARLGARVARPRARLPRTASGAQRSTRAAAPVLLAHANVTENLNIFSMGPKLRYPTASHCICALALPMYRYRYDWKREEAEKYILRTHTTAVSARMLYEVANVKC